MYELAKLSLFVNSLTLNTMSAMRHSRFANIRQVHSFNALSNAKAGAANYPFVQN